MIENKTEKTLPAGLWVALRRKNEPLQFTAVFHAVWLGGEKFVGVAGDGANAGYEWFVWDGKELKTSDCGYGSASVALRDVLVAEEP